MIPFMAAGIAGFIALVQLGRDSWVARKSAMRRADFFAKLDTDKTGTLDYFEVESGLKKRGFKEHEIRIVFNALDVNKDGVINRSEWDKTAIPAVVDGSTTREEYLKRYHPEILQTERALTVQSTRSAPSEHGLDDLDLPEAFTYEDDVPVTLPLRTVKIDHFSGSEVNADFGFLDRTATNSAGGPVAWSDLKAPPDGTKSQSARPPTKSAESEYVAC